MICMYVKKTTDGIHIALCIINNDIAGFLQKILQCFSVLFLSALKIMIFMLIYAIQLLICDIFELLLSFFFKMKKKDVISFKILTARDQIWKWQLKAKKISLFFFNLKNRLKLEKDCLSQLFPRYLGLHFVHIKWISQLPLPYLLDPGCQAVTSAIFPIFTLQIKCFSTFFVGCFIFCIFLFSHSA